MTALEVSRVRKAYGSHAALRGVSLSVPGDSYFVLLGPSGSGKTTLLSILGGFVQPTDGRVVLDGQDITLLPPAQRPTTTVFQDYGARPRGHGGDRAPQRGPLPGRGGGGGVSAPGASAARAPGGGRLFRLVRKTRESAVISSFLLEPDDGAPLWPYTAGQYLPVEIEGAGPAPIARTYTISAAPSRQRAYRLTVKREAGRAGTPDGAASCWLHDRFVPGMAIRAYRPRGDFVLQDSDRPVVLLSGGVGITPMLAFLGDLAENRPERPVWFLHACRDGSVHAMRDEVLALARRHGRATVRFFYGRPRAGDVEGRDFDVAGRIDVDALKRLLPFDDHEFYLCGPTGFMRTLHAGLTGLNVDPARISHEFFGPTVALSTGGVRKPPASKPPAAPEQVPEAAGRRVVFARSGVEANWDGAQDSLLALAESVGLSPEFSCREGICGTCRTRLLSGSVDYRDEPIAFTGEGEVLLCVATPGEEVELDL
jgi:uncharacterized protein